VGDLNPATIGNKLSEKQRGSTQCVAGTHAFNLYGQYYDKDGNKVTITEAEYNKNPGSYYFKTNSKRDNLNDDSNLTEAINSLDEILGAKSRIDNNKDKKENEDPPHTKANYITNGTLASSLNGDYRGYNIPEDNVMDALVHHDADIGFIEDITTKNTYNAAFIK